MVQVLMICRTRLASPTNRQPRTSPRTSSSTFPARKCCFRWLLAHTTASTYLVQSSMPSEPEQDQNWDSCPTGLLSKTAEIRLETPIEQNKRLRWNALWITVSFALVIMLAGYALIEARPVAPTHDASLSCQTVRANLAAFCNNQIHDASFERKISKHLMVCKPCHAEYRSTCGCSKRCPNRIRKAITKPCLAQQYK